MCCERQFPAKILFLLATQSLASSRTAIVVDTYGDLETLVSEDERSVSGGKITIHRRWF